MADMNTVEQIPLQFHRFEALSFDHYLIGNNTAVMQTIEAMLDGSENNPLYLWGKPATGKSHLLQATCEKASRLGLNVAYLPLAMIIDHPVESLEGLEQQDLICIDDMHSIKAQQHWQTAVFHLYNRIRENSRRLIISADQSPMTIPIELADLKSRLSWGNTMQLHELDDPLKSQLLQHKASQRGFDLADDVVDFLLKRTGRDLRHLLTLLDNIDRYSLAQQRKITIPFVKSLLSAKNAASTQP